MSDERKLVVRANKPGVPSPAHVAAVMAHFFGGGAARGGSRPAKAKVGAAGRRAGRRRKTVVASAGPVRSAPLEALKDLAVQALAEKKGAFLSVHADEKGVLSTAGVEKGMAREYARTLIGSRPLRVNLVQEIAAVTVTANTAMAVSTPANYVAATEYSSWAALFDEVRCLSYKARHNVGFYSTALENVGTSYAVAISPAINTAPSSIVQTVGFTKFAGPVPLHPGAAGTPAAAGGEGACITAVSNHGLLEIESGPLMKGVTTNNSGGTLTVNPVQGNWVPTGTNSAHAGYLLLYGDQPGVGVQWTYRIWIWYSLEFRSRSG
jgi:hypothetical protein